MDRRTQYVWILITIGLFPINTSNIYAQVDSGWIWLFDGSNVDHWRSQDYDGFPSKGWEIEDGELIVNKGGIRENRGGSIISKEQYQNFDLAFDFKFTSEANGGIKYMLKEYPDGSMLGCEYQIIDDFSNKDIAHDRDEKRLSASLYELFEASQKVLKPAGSWNNGKIRVMGKQVEHWLNDVLVVSYERGSTEFLKAKAGSKFRSIADFAEVESGHIMIQDHGDEIAFRNIRIRNTNHQYPTYFKSAIYEDVGFLQDYAVKFPLSNSFPLKTVCIDRNGRCSILADGKLWTPVNGVFQYPGKLMVDNHYASMSEVIIRQIATFQAQFIYLTSEAVFSNAWAGKLHIKHDLPQATILCPGANGVFVISDGHSIIGLDTSGQVLINASSKDEILEIIYDPVAADFLVLTAETVVSISSSSTSVKSLTKGNEFTCIAIHSGQIIIGTRNGYLKLERSNEDALSEKVFRLPHPELSSVASIGGQLWFGSTRGAFMQKDDGTFNYYSGRRWLVDNRVISIVGDPGKDVAILTEEGLTIIKFDKMTLQDKAAIYDDQVRQRHIRYGLYCDQARVQDGDLSTSQVSTQASDNLWSGMYLVSQLFRYLVTGEAVAKLNCLETFEAMERLHTINGVQGLFGRSFERKGIKEYKAAYRKYAEDYWYPDYATSIAWHNVNEEWDWEGTASSDQVVGQIFALTMVAEFIDDEAIRNRAIQLLDHLMGYILENNYQLIDVDGRPTLWGRWNPEFINRFGTMIGDRRLGSSNIVAFLQSAYYFTKKEKYRVAVEDLLFNHGYLENLTRPIDQIGKAPDDANAWSKMLSQEWNHSDDEMYFLAYWSLYKHALTDELREKYREAIKDHWDFERSEKDALWNFSYAITGASEFDLGESIWHLKEFPLDLMQYAVENSHRKDISIVPPNFRGETTVELLPPDERPELKHNRNLFTLDSKDRGSELGAGDTFLLPYWMGRFLGVITKSQK